MQNTSQLMEHETLGFISHLWQPRREAEWCMNSSSDWWMFGVVCSKALLTLPSRHGFTLWTSAIGIWITEGWRTVNCGQCVSCIFR